MLVNSVHQQTMQSAVCIEQTACAALIHKTSLITKYAFNDSENSPAEHMMDALGLDVSGCQKAEA